MSIETISFVLLGISVIVHIVFVTADLGSGILAALYRHLSYIRRNEEYELISKQLFRFMIISELFSGVWGTIITVFLAGFYGSLVSLSTNVLFVPIAISIASIMVRIPSIASSWYLWNRIKAKYHIILMWIMALSGFGVPLGFRTIFAEINYPYAIASYMSSGKFSAFATFSNPIYWYLLLHTVLASISVGGYLLASISALENKNHLLKIGTKIGLSFLLMQASSGMIYYISLSSYSQLLFNKINTLTLPVFALKLVLVGLLLYLSIETLQENSIVKNFKNFSLAPLSLIIVALGEFLNGGSRYPYFVITGSSGITIDAFFNYLMPIPVGAVAVIMVFVVVGVAVFSLALYYGLIKRFVLSPP